MAAEPVSSRPLLMSNGAPDRLRRLSVDADEGSSHVFRVTEADRLRDAFDGFDRRLDPASGQIGTESFHHTRRCGPGLGSEGAAELAQAHARRFRQAFDGEHFGDVVAGIAKSRGNSIILWCQINGRCELRLPAVAAMVDDEVLGHAFGDGKTMVFFDQRQRKVDAGRDTG